MQNNHPNRSFWQKSNDLQCRAWPYRLSRFLRAKLHLWTAKVMLLADEPRAFQAWRRKWDPEHYVRLRRWHDRGFRPQIVYDIGAYKGAWSEMCHTIFAPRRILLFEPQVDFQQQARARQPKDANWQVVPVALGDSEETQSLHVTQNRSASSMLAPLVDGVPQEWGTGTLARQEVQVAPLDRLVAQADLPPPDLIKIDVQGFEGRVIAGGKTIIAKAQRMVIEVSLRAIYKGQPLLPEILQTVSELGFEVEDLTETCREWAGPLWQTDLWLKRRDL